MGTNVNAGGNLADAIARNKANGVATAPRMTEPGTTEATKGVSLQEQMAQMMIMMQTQAQVIADLQASKAKGGKAKADKPKAEPESGPWYMGKAFIGRMTKAEDGKPPKAFYDVDLKSIKATENVAIMRSNAFAATLLFIKGKRKPIYLSAESLYTLLGDAPTLQDFVTANESYLDQCIADKQAEAE